MSSPSAISNGPTLQDIVTGLIVPQTSVTPATYAARQPPTPIFHTDACGVFGFADTYKNIPAGVKVGVRLRDTLALNISSLIFTGGQTPSEQMMDGYAEKSLSLVIQVGVLPPHGADDAHTEKPVARMPSDGAVQNQLHSPTMGAGPRCLRGGKDDAMVLQGMYPVGYRPVWAQRADCVCAAEFSQTYRREGPRARLEYTKRRRAV